MQSGAEQEFPESPTNFIGYWTINVFIIIPYFVDVSWIKWRREPIQKNYLPKRCPYKIRGSISNASEYGHVVYVANLKTNLYNNYNTYFYSAFLRELKGALSHEIQQHYSKKWRNIGYALNCQWQNEVLPRLNISFKITITICHDGH